MSALDSDPFRSKELTERQMIYALSVAKAWEPNLCRTGMEGIRLHAYDWQFQRLGECDN